jgi:uncharacterized protein YggT (Ycf19 family)
VGICFLSWLPNLNWEFLPLKVLWYIVGLFMKLFDPFIPRIVGINFSPILAIAVLMFVKKHLNLCFMSLISNTNSEYKND